MSRKRNTAIKKDLKNAAVMSPTLKNALKNAAVLTIVAVSAALLLALANVFLKVEYVPTIDKKTVAILNALEPTGADDETALAEGYFDFALSPDAVAAWNKKNIVGSRQKVIAVFKAAAGENKDGGTVFVEAEATGYNGKIALITAVNADGTLLGIGVRSIPSAEFYSKNIEAINGHIRSKKAVTTAELKPLVYTGASARVTTTAFVDAIMLSVKISGEVSASDGQKGI
ncbi:MAG: hypothetical protein FWD58_03665 [Firmicutes bacterium]|nr:hypothetical protein [Bacillota bacterium]